MGYPDFYTQLLTGAQGVQSITLTAGETMALIYHNTLSSNVSQVPVTLNPPTNATQAVIRQTYVYPDPLQESGSASAATCAIPGNCTIPLDSGFGDPYIQVTYLSASNTVMRTDAAVAFSATGVSPLALGPWTNGQVINTILTATGFSGTVTWSLASGTQPTGLGGTCITGTTGNTCTLAGTLSAAGTFNFTIRATDGTTIINTPYAITVDIAPAITTVSMPTGSVGVAYSKQLTTSGGLAPVICNLTTGALPNGLSLDSNSCTISGTPTVVNNFPFSVTPIDSNGVPGIAQNLTITILGTCAITPTSIGPYNARQTVSQTLTQTGCNTSTFTIFSGSLAGSGLSLSPQGVLSGTAIQGAFSVTVAYDTATNPLTFTIGPSLLPATSSGHTSTGGKATH